MATGGEIVKSLVKFIHLHFNLAIADFEDSIDEGFTTPDQGIITLKGCPLPDNIKELLTCFEEAKVGSQFIIDVYTVPDRIEIIDFDSMEYLKRNRPFTISDQQFGYLSTKKIFEFFPISSIEREPEGFKTLVDFVSSCLLLPQNQLLIDLIDILISTNAKRGLLVHKFFHTYDTGNIYAYLYYQGMLQGRTIELDPTLRYSLNHGSSTTFNHQVIYPQYFEIYDIVNELNHAKDIITRFLKMYHILEYLVYRVELVKVEEKARNNRTFIREMHALAGKGSNEWEIFRRNFSVIFAVEVTAGYFSFGVLTAEQRLFFKNYLGLDSYNPNDAFQVSSLIYKVRNSIVHNKESEFHMTTSNPDDYKEIIPLMTVLIQKLETKALEKISSNFDKISYKGNRYIPLY